MYLVLTFGYISAGAAVLSVGSCLLVPRSWNSRSRLSLFWTFGLCWAALSLVWILLGFAGHRHGCDVVQVVLVNPLEEKGRLLRLRSHRLAGSASVKVSRSRRKSLVRTMRRGEMLLDQAFGIIAKCMVA